MTIYNLELAKRIGKQIADLIVKDINKKNNSIWDSDTENNTNKEEK